MDATEVEFLAEKFPITIVPNFSQEKLYLISGDVGPFNPGESSIHNFLLCASILPSYKLCQACEISETQSSA